MDLRHANGWVVTNKHVVEGATKVFARSTDESGSMVYNDRWCVELPAAQQWWSFAACEETSQVYMRLAGVNAPDVAVLPVFIPDGFALSNINDSYDFIRRPLEELEITAFPSSVKQSSALKLSTNFAERFDPTLGVALMSCPSLVSGCSGAAVYTRDFVSHSGSQADAARDVAANCRCLVGILSHGKFAAGADVNGVAPYTVVWGWQLVRSLINQVRVASGLEPDTGDVYYTAVIPPSAAIAEAGKAGRSNSVGRNTRMMNALSTTGS